MKRLAHIVLAALAVALPTSSWAQNNVLQGGPFDSGRVPMYVNPGNTQPIVQDSGPAGGGQTGVGLKELLLTSRGTGSPPYIATGSGPLGTNLCSYDAPVDNPTGYHWLCFSPNSQGGALIASGAGGGASNIPLNVSVNGVLFPIGSGGGGGSSLQVGTTPVTDGTNGNILYNNAGILGDLNLFGTANSWTGIQTFGAGATAPTQPIGDNSTAVATTAFVEAATGGGVAGANTVFGNWTNTLGTNIANPMPSCPDIDGHHLNYFTGIGIFCGSGGGGGGSAAGSLTGTTMAANVVNSSLQTVGILTGGATGTGFTIALSTSTLTGILPAARLPAFTGGDVTSSAGSAVLSIGNLAVTNAMIANATINLTTKVTNVLPIANGGTGASTAATALSSLGALPLAGGTMAGNLILNADPTTNLQAATKQYVDLNASGVQPKAAVAAASPVGSNINISSAPSSLDTVTGTAGMRWLLKDQTSLAQNGIYVFASAGAALTRATDLDFWPEAVGASTLVTGGTQLDTGWTAQAAPGGTIGTTPMPWVQTSAQIAYSAGAGLNLSGTTFSIATGGVTNAMLAGSITASKLVGADITTVGNITSGGWLASNVGTAHGGTGQDLSATSGVMLITGGVVSMISGGTGSGGVVRDTNSSAANLTVSGTLTVNQLVALIGTVPNILMTPTGAPRAAAIYQTTGPDIFHIATSGVLDRMTIDLSNGSTAIGGNLAVNGVGALSQPFRVHTGTDNNITFISFGGASGIESDNDVVGAFKPLTIDATTLAINSRTLGPVTIGPNAATGGAKLEVSSPSIAYNSGSGAIIASNTADANKKLLLGYDAGLGANGSGYIQAIRTGVSFTPLLLNPSAGAVGVGTTNPIGALEVRTGADHNIMMSDTGGNSFLWFRNDANSAFTGGNIDATTLAFNQFVGGTILMLNSNVGIGVSPSTTFDVNGSAAVRGTMAIGSTTLSRNLSITSGGVSISFIDAGSEQWAMGVEGGGAAERFSMFSSAGFYAFNISHSNGFMNIAGPVGVNGGNPAGGIGLTSNGPGAFTTGGAGPDNGYNGGLRTTQPTGSGQYINMIRSGTAVWSIGMVYNSSVFAIGGGQGTDSSFNAPRLAMDLNCMAIGTNTPYTPCSLEFGHTGVAMGVDSAGQGQVKINPFVDSHYTTSGLAVRMIDSDASNSGGNGLDFALIGTIQSIHNNGVFANKVGTMGSAQATGGSSGNIWGMYAECQLDPGSNPSGVCIGIEVDNNNNVGDKSTNWGAPSYGVQITGASTYTSTAALFISTGLGAVQWYTGILYVGNGITWGIDFAPDVTPSNYFAGAAIRIPNNTAIAWRDNTNTVNINAFYMDTGNRFQLGGGYPIGANLQANPASWIVCWDGNLISYQDYNVGCPASSARFKQNIEPIPIDRAFDIATKLQPVSFQYKPELYKSDQKVDDQTHLGFIAEQVTEVDPALAAYDAEGKPSGVKYNEMWPIVMGAIQHLKADNDNLRARLEAIEAKVSNSK